MTKYRKKPVVIDAWQLTKENVEVGIPDWIDLDMVHIFDGGVLFAGMEIPEIEADHNALDDCIRQAKEVSYFIANLQHDGA